MKHCWSCGNLINQDVVICGKCRTKQQHVLDNGGARSDEMHFGLPAQVRQLILAIILVGFVAWAISVYPDPTPASEATPDITNVISAADQLTTPAPRRDQ